ncbi:MAG: TOBE domain-containing protein [Deltaproteobacteria bacterium]|jgi:molybdate transport system regulatory protein|nr:TOBE domain-containing protein [Deltaproteobacteria bacterium]
MSQPLSNSARNQFKGTVSKLTKGMVNTEVILDIGDGKTVTAVITNASVDYLGLQTGSVAHALFKASWVILNRESDFKTSARNNFPGKVKSAKPGAVNAEIIVDISGDGKTELVAIVTNESLERLGLKEGVEVNALIKSSHVIIGTK